MLQGVSQVLWGADSGEMGLDGCVGVQALAVGVTDGLAWQRVGLVDGGAHRDDRYDCCGSDRGCHCCHSLSLHGGPAVQDTAGGLWGPTARTPIGPAPTSDFPLLSRAPTHGLLIQPVPLVSHLEQNLGVNASTFSCFFDRHAGLFQHHVVLETDIEQHCGRFYNITTAFLDITATTEGHTGQSGLLGQCESM